MLITNIDDVRQELNAFEAETVKLAALVVQLERWSWERRIWLLLRSIPSRVRRIFGR